MSLKCQNFFRLSSAKQRKLFYRRLCITVAISFRVSATIFAIISVRNMIIFIPLIVTTVRASQIFILIAALSARTTLGLTVTMFRVINGSARKNIRVSVGIRVAMTNVRVSLVRITNGVLSNGHTMTRFISNSTLFRLISLTVSMLRFRVTIIRPISVSITMFNFDIRLPSVSRARIKMLTISVRLQTITSEKFTTVNRIRDNIISVKSVRVTVLRISTRESHRVATVRVTMFSVRVTFSLVIFQRSSVTMLLYRITHRFEQRVSVMISNRKFIETSVPILQPRTYGNQGHVTRLFRPCISAISSDLHLFIVANFHLSRSASKSFTLTPVHGHGISMAIIGLRSIIFASVRTFISFLFLSTFLFNDPAKCTTGRGRRRRRANPWGTKLSLLNILVDYFRILVGYFVY